MKTVALRFAENFAPDCGTIAAHQQLIDTKGFVWYGKLGSAVSSSTSCAILANKDPRILLIHSGGFGRYWLHVSAISRDTPPLFDIPEYYRDMAEKMKTWFRVTAIETAQKDVMSHCFVASSKKVLTEASRQSMSPYFIVEYNEEG